jgi:ribonuclease D
VSDLPLATIVTSRSALEKVMRDLGSQDAVAVDTESNSLYAYHERICLIQISTSRSDYIVDPLADLSLEPLGRFFANPGIQKVFHAAEQDVAGLKRDLGFRFANLFDTMWAARILGWPKVGLANILEERFQVRTNKRFQRHNWGKRPLEPRAVAYAQADTHYLLQLRELQMKELEGKGRSREASEVFAQIATTEAAKNPFGPDAFWRVKGRHKLPENEQAMLWELYQWRDKKANSRNKPPFRIMGDARLVEIVKSQPSTLEELGELGLKPRAVRAHGQELLAAVSRGNKAQLPRHPSTSRRPDEAVKGRYKALRAWRVKAAKQRQVDTDVIISNAVLWDLAERDPRSMRELEQMEDLGSWKRKTYGPDLLQVLKRMRRNSRK